MMAVFDYFILGIRRVVKATMDAQLTLMVLTIC
jgi:hypothetical protein